MSYFKKIQWKIVANGNTKVVRNCPKCNKKSDFYSTEKFRINANKGNIDVWLIYKCGKCKSTWNMSIYERINIKDISMEEYDKFLANDKKLAESYGSNVEIHNKNKSELIMELDDYQVIEKEIGNGEIEDTIKIELVLDQPVKLRLDKLISSQLNISRTEVKRMYQEGFIYFDKDKKIIKSKIEDGMIIYLEKPL